jgi:putative DNA primase/helicase
MIRPDTKAGKAKILGIFDSAEQASIADLTPDCSDPPPASDGKSSKEAAKKGGAKRRKKRPPQRDSLLSILETIDKELWHNPNKEGFITFSVNGHREHWALRSGEARRWLGQIYWEKTGGALGGQAMQDTLGVLEGRAVNCGPQYRCFRRIGECDGSLFLDLCDESWRVIEIGPRSWRVVSAPHVKLLRTSAMRALPVPEAGEPIETLRGFINVGTDDDFVLVVSWLVGSIQVKGPFPILVISGEQGSAKSVAATLLRSLIDPSEAPLRSAPRDDQNLIIAASNSHVLAFDNLSGLANWFSDALCRIATGSGYSTRRLHTDSDEVVFSAARPIILNGIPALTERQDLADRSIAIHLPTISNYRPEDEFWRDFDAAKPFILGALLDAVVSSLRNLPTTKLDRFPRMADFAKRIKAAEPGLGWAPGTTIEAVERNRQTMFEEAAEADPLVLIIRERWDCLLGCRDTGDGAWEGRPTDLFHDLNSIADEGSRKSKWWPATPAALGTRIRRSAPTLRQCGFLVEKSRGASRNYRIIRRSQ